MRADRDIAALELGFGYVCVTKRVQKQQNFKKYRIQTRLCYKTCPKIAKFKKVQKSDTLVLQNVSKPAKFIFRSDGDASFLL